MMETIKLDFKWQLMGYQLQGIFEENFKVTLVLYFSTIFSAFTLDIIMSENKMFIILSFVIIMNYIFFKHEKERILHSCCFNNKIFNDYLK